MAGPEPERELIRKVTPIGVAAIPITFFAGFGVGGWGIGLSAAIGVAVVLGNFLANAASLAWAATISPVIVYAVGLGGYVVRLMVFVVLMVLLRQLDWFSTVAFIATFVPATVVLLVAEMKLLSGRMQADLWTLPDVPSPRGPERVDP